MHETVELRLDRERYEIRVGSGLLEELGQALRDLVPNLPNRCAVITDATVGRLYSAVTVESLTDVGFIPSVFTVPAGEASKSIAQAGDLCEQMIQAGFGRHGFVVALGGGVVGDLAGFVAAIFCRGIPVVQVPTTVMAQVDSSVGGKTGVNAPSGKNLIGAFHQPAAVIADVKTLSTLPRREYLEGFAEVIKHGCIRDADMLELLEESGSNLDAATRARVVARNVAIKARVVMNDEKETRGERALLNFGHTIGHGIEQAAGYGNMLHGEAVSLGLVAALRLSARKAGLAEDQAERAIALLRQFDLPVTLPAEISQDSILKALRTDKKFVEGEIRFVLVPRLGEAIVSRDVSEEEIREAVAGLME